MPITSQISVSYTPTLYFVGFCSHIHHIHFRAQPCLVSDLFKIKLITLENESIILEQHVPFAKSLFWQLNRDYYQNNGIDAWREDDVPSHLTTNSMVGMTYANLIFAFLKDLAFHQKSEEIVYFLELGAGQGRLAFHVLKHLTALTENYGQPLPPFCYILSDIVEENLNFYLDHPQFKPYFEAGLLDVCYFDGVVTKALNLKFKELKIDAKCLKQPLVVIANYFFDSIPNDLFFIENGDVTPCSVTLTTEKMDEPITHLKDIDITYQRMEGKMPFYENEGFNDLIDTYTKELSHTFLLFPHMALQCLLNLDGLSDQGLMLISMDKGFHAMQDLDKFPEPELITHGSASLWVNYHALSSFCHKLGGKALLPQNSSFNLELVSLLMTKKHEQFPETQMAYHHFVNVFGPDDFNTLKKWSFKHIETMTLKEWIAILRLSAYDSVMFIALLPRLKQLYPEISIHERRRISETFHKTWDMYFALNENFDLAFAMAGIFYDLAYYEDAITFFNHSMNLFGSRADALYNIALCHYQLRQDIQFECLLLEIKKEFPDFTKIGELTKLDLSAK